MNKNYRKTYHVRCFCYDCLYIHQGICHCGIITINDLGRCLSYQNKETIALKNNIYSEITDERE